MRPVDLLCFSLVGLTWACLAAVARKWWVLERGHRLMIRAQKMAFKHRRRANIIGLGMISIDPQGRLLPIGWKFHYDGSVPLVVVVSDGDKPVTLWGGYTAEELADIASRPQEFTA